MSSFETCAYCHLPISSRGVERHLSGKTRRFCCYGCFLVYRIAERKEETSSWLLARLGISTFLTMCTMILSWLLAETLENNPRPEIVFLLRWGTWALATPVLILLGYPLLKQGFVALRSRSVSLEAGIGLTCTVIYGISFANLCRGRLEIHFDTVCGTVLLVTLGMILEATSKSAAARDIREFLGRDKIPAFRVEGDEVGRTSASSLVPGDIVRVPCGYTVPADGYVLEGESRVRLTPLTGEREPKLRKEGDEILEGGKVIDNTLTVQVARTGDRTVLSGLLSRVDDAVLVPSQTRYVIDRALVLFRPLVALVAMGTFVWWWPRSHTAAWFHLLSVLVIAYPCGLVLMTPVATTLAVARAAREGVLLAQAAAVERLARVTACFFDETVPAQKVSRPSGSEERELSHSASIGVRRLASVVRKATGVATSSGVTRAPDTTEVNRRRMQIVELCTSLHERGLRTILLTGPSLMNNQGGDRPSAIDGIYVGLHNEEKKRLIQSYRHQGHSVALISTERDDLQDLGETSLSVTVGAACGGEIPDSPITLLGNDLERLPWLIDLSRRVLRTVNWNLAWCSFYSVAGIFAAVAGIFDPVFAAAVMLIGGTLVAGNTAQIHSYPGPSQRK